jgi:hypothetical protein
MRAELNLPKSLWNCFNPRTLSAQRPGDHGADSIRRSASNQFREVIRDTEATEDHPVKALGQHPIATKAALRPQIEISASTLIQLDALAFAGASRFMIISSLTGPDHAWPVISEAAAESSP